MNNKDRILRALEFQCASERFPPASPDLDKVFKYARWLQKGNQLSQNKSVYDDVERLYRLAAENGHAKANVNMHYGAMSGQFSLRSRERRRLAERLVEDGVASGYYLIGIYLQQGLAGLAQDQEMSLRYFRRAADEGSPLAQYLVGEKLSPVEMAPQVALEMFRCAAMQGHAKAALTLAVELKMDGKFSEALEMFQLSVANGSSTAAVYLEDAFNGPSSEDKLDYLGQAKDEKRVARYAEISRILGNYSYANPTVPEVNDIVPLPPAQLPPWDGKLRWLEDRLANIPPEQPSEALLEELAKAQGLDPATGRPMPGSPAFSKYRFPQNVELSGQACPESGYWKACPGSPYRMLEESVRYFEKGQILPPVELEYTQRRSWPLADQIHHCRRNIQWGLMG